MMEISGRCEPRFARVREAFEKNFSRRGEHGAAVAVVHEGELVVDLWGGWRDSAKTLPWTANTLVTAQSTTKGIVAGLAHWLVERGKLSWPASVASYWPEFAQNGKSDITVEQVISHQAGLCVIDAPLPPGATLEWARIITALEQQRPVWPPGERFGYHAVTWSFLVGELIRRASGSTMSELFAQVFAAPWKLDFFLGLSEKDADRTAEFLPAPDGSAYPIGEETPYRARTFQVSPPRPGVTPNSPEARRAPANGFGTARALARYYGGLANGGILDNARVLLDRTAATMGETIVEGDDAVIGARRRFGRGFWLHYPVRNAVRGPRAFGHPGLGGSFGLADPDRRLGIAYTMNLPGAYLRAANLELAVYHSLNPPTGYTRRSNP